MFMNRDNRVHKAISPNVQESAFCDFSLDVPDFQNFDFSCVEWNVKP